MALEPGPTEILVSVDAYGIGPDDRGVPDAEAAATVLLGAEALVHAFLMSAARPLEPGEYYAVSLRRAEPGSLTLLLLVLAVKLGPAAAAFAQAQAINPLVTLLSGQAATALTNGLTVGGAIYGAGRYLRRQPPIVGGDDARTQTTAVERIWHLANLLHQRDATLTIKNSAGVIELTADSLARMIASDTTPTPRSEPGGSALPT